MNQIFILLLRVDICELELFLLMIVPLDDFFGGFIAIHDGHVEVHKNETVLLLTALFVEVVVLEHVHRLEAVHSLVTLQREVHFQN
jgi:hypothetical protein